MRLLALCLALVTVLGASVARGQDDGSGYDYVSLSAKTDRASYHAGDKATVTLEFKIDPRVHINAHVPTEEWQFPTNVEFADHAGLQLSEIEWPKPNLKEFEFSDGKKIAVLEGAQQATFQVTIPANAKPGALTVSGKFKAQGCTHAACFAPQSDEFNVALQVEAGGASSAAPAGTSSPAPPGSGSASAPPRPAEPAAAPSATAAAPAEPEPQTAAPTETTPAQPATTSGEVPAAAAASPTPAALDGENHAKAFDCPVNTPPPPPQRLILVFMLSYMGGILLAFTPCVLPLVPVTIGIFARQQSSGGKPVVPALMYVFGLAVVYSALGTSAALTGNLFGSALQSTWVRVGMSAFLFALALSMFGLWDLNLPAGFRNRIGGFKSGPIGPLLMGGAMGLVAAPCVGPLVASLLTYVANLGARMPTTQAAIIGGALFFVLALGIGTPFFIVALGAASIRPGEWMDSVKRFFGFAILGAVLWFLLPILGPVLFKWGVVVLVAAAAIFFLATARGPHVSDRLKLVHRVIGTTAAVSGVVLAAFFLLRRETGPDDGFVKYSEEALTQSIGAARPVVIDFGADWCIACKELEHKTFPADEVRKEEKDFTLLRANLTEEDAPDVKALREKFSVGSLPTVIFLDTAGKEIKDLRLVGFEKPELFALRLKCVTSVTVASAVK